MSSHIYIGGQYKNSSKLDANLGLSAVSLISRYFTRDYCRVDFQVGKSSSGGRF